MCFSRPGSSTTKSSWVLKTALSTSTNSARPTSFHSRVPARHRRNELQGARQSRTDEPEIVEPVGPRSHPIASCLAFEATTFPACFTAENQHDHSSPPHRHYRRLDPS